MQSKQNKKKKSRKPVVDLNLKCPFGDNPALIDYKNAHQLKQFISTRGRILPPSKTGVCAKCQRKLTVSIKRARLLGLLPYVKYV